MAVLVRSARLGSVAKLASKGWSRLSSELSEVVRRPSMVVRAVKTTIRKRCSMLTWDFFKMPCWEKNPMLTWENLMSTWDFFPLFILGIEFGRSRTGKGSSEGRKKGVVCLSTRLAHRCPGTGCCLPPTHACLRRCFIFALHVVLPFYLGRKITIHQKVCTILLYLTCQNN